ncbi:transposase, partial [bacterium]|nr:transposase [bacterium]
MAKKDKYLLLASQLYIERQMSIAAIAKRLDVSEKSLFAWKKEEEWDKKRARYLKSMYSCNQNLYELLNLVTKKALDDFYRDSLIPEQKTLYFIMNMESRLKDLKA